MTTDRLDLALRRYESIYPQDIVDQQLGQAERLSHWLANDVCSVIDELVIRSDFRHLARWSIDNLAPDARGRVRDLVNTVDRSLVEAATQLSRLANRPAMRRALADYEGRRTRGGTGGKKLTARSKIASGSTRKTVAEFVALRPWHDLVSVHDFFHVVAELNLVDRAEWLGPDSAQTGIGEFLAFVRPDLRLPGDFVTRGLMIRIEYWRSRLASYEVHCQEAIAKARAQTKAIKEQLAETLRGLDEPLQKLQDLCCNGADARRRKAAMGLVQIFAAYRPRKDFSWLGPAGALFGNATGMRYWVEQRGDLEIPNLIATALLEMLPLYRSDLDPDAKAEAKAKEVRLVVISRPGGNALWWEGKRLDIDWASKGRAWTLMENLALKAKTGQGVDRFNDLPISLKDARSDLKKLLPPALNELVTANRGTYTLKLRPTEVYVGEIQSEERLRAHP